MSAQEIVEVVGELVVDDGERLRQQHGSRALTAAREMETALVPRLQENEMQATIWQQFQEAPGAGAPYLVLAVEDLLNADAALAWRLDALLGQYRRATRRAGGRVDTGGGAYVGGSVSVEGGDFVGRDETTVSGGGNAISDHGRSTVVKQTADPEAVARAFRLFYDAVEAKPDLSDPERADLKAELEEVEEELAKGEGADEGFIARRLRSVKRMAPDIWDVVITTFGNPVAGLGMVGKKIAARMKAEADGA